MNSRATLAVCITTLLAGCSSLLPKGTADSPTPFTSYAQAEAAVARITPFKTKPSELPQLGFDAQDGRNVTLITYPNIVARLAPYPVVPL